MASVASRPGKTWQVRQGQLATDTDTRHTEHVGTVQSFVQSRNEITIASLGEPAAVKLREICWAFHGSLVPANDGLWIAQSDNYTGIRR